MYSTRQLSELLNGKFIGKLNRPVKHLIIDSRKLSSAPDGIFFAITGLHQDGHRFIPELYKNGLLNFVVERLPENTENYTNACFIQVTGSLAALQKLAAYHRSQFSIPVIGITGSNGKTIVKEWLFQLLREDKNIVRSPKSYNSQVGVPLSVWQLNEENELALFEAGISQKGEMQKLEEIIRPTIGILTNIGEAHSQNFTDAAEKAAEKIKLFARADTLLFCDDYPAIANAVNTLTCRKKISWSRKNKKATYFISDQINEKDSALECTDSKGNRNSLLIPFTDEASVENAIHCWILLMELGYSQGLIQKRMLSLSTVAMRLEMKQGINNCLIINDSYNSDLGSLSIALDFLNQQKQHLKKTLILSDILQSAKEEATLYKEVAHLLENKGIHRLIAIGPALMRQAKHFGIDKHFFESTESFLMASSGSEFKNEAILIKGARPFEFEKISRQLQQKAHETVMEIDLNAVVHNLNYFRSKLKASTRLMAMVKASSYGSGSYEIANILQYHRVDYLAVAYADEGVELRKAGITLPVMVMNPQEQGYEAMIEYDLEPEIFSMRVLRKFSEVAGIRNKPVQIHLKIDTGMHRLGFDPEQITGLISSLRENQNIHVASLFSHLSCAEDPAQDDFTRGQIALFGTICDQLQTALGYNMQRHILNSAGISRFPEAQMDMVRLGIGLYGIGCNAEEQKKLEFANSLKTVISQIKILPPGASVGYNRRFISNKEMKIATVPIGYADGLSRRLSNGRGKLHIKGKPAPILGNVCMDMCMIDISGTDASEGDEVLVFGAAYPITLFAVDCETIPYEVLTSMSGRVKRVYFQE